MSGEKYLKKKETDQMTFIKKKSFMRITALGMVTAFIVTGCGSKTNAFNNYNVQIPISSNENNVDEIYSQDYLSDGICVIPSGKQSKSDDVMTSTAALMINDTSDKMLFSKNIYKKMYPASITKIVTALVTLKYADLNDTVTISYNASHITEYGAKLCGFAEGDKIKLKKLLYSFLICSGNDAGIAIAEHVGGTVENFADMMNKEMKELGAVNSHFVNPHGLHDDNHYTSAYDLYLVFHELLKYDTFLDIINRPYYVAKFKGASGKKKTLYFKSTDKYLTGAATAPDGVNVIGGKTGTTMAAGSNLILYSQDKDKNDYISVVMHAEHSYSLYTQMTHLLEMEIK